jgi:hypothetical protein
LTSPDLRVKQKMRALPKQYGVISIFSGVLLLLAMGIVFFAPTYEVWIENASEKTLIQKLTAKPGNNLWLIHINSVENLPVAERYEIMKNYQFAFSEVIYQAPYVGYLNDNNPEIIAPGTVRITDFITPMETVSFFAGDISKHLMFWNGKWLPLYEGARGGDLICITIKKITGFNRLFNRKEIVP